MGGSPGDRTGWGSLGKDCLGLRSALHGSEQMSQPQAPGLQLGDAQHRGPDTGVPQGEGERGAGAVGPPLKCMPPAVSVCNGVVLTGQAASP